jgi:hypothetical protein
MLADIDDPPRSRLPGVLWGMVIAAPVVALLVAYVVPMLVGTVLRGAQNLDERLRLEDGYMTGVCGGVMQIDRDQDLCECVLAVEFPSLDCQGPFLAWSVTRQMEYCADPTHERASLSFCSCVITVSEKMEAAQDEVAREKAAQAYRNCQTLDDAVYLPTIEELEAIAVTHARR